MITPPHDSRRGTPSGAGPNSEDLGPAGERLTRAVGRRAARRRRAEQETRRTVWFGLGMFGLIGWSVAVPTVAGAALGAWIDSRWPTRYSWTLMLLITGLALGCLNAWSWVRRETAGDADAGDSDGDPHHDS